MNRTSKTIGLVLLVATGSLLATIGADATPPGNSSEVSNSKLAAETKAAPLPSVAEARGRARLLHETIQAMLQVVHHEYYREDEKLPIPARTFKKVFRELADHQKVEIRWLAVTGQAMNQDHTPQNDFEKQAVREIASGAEEYELAENGIYRRAGVITLTSECLKCHVPNRTNVKNRAAGLVIAMPIDRK
jgi:hypothetical protein